MYFTIFAKFASKSCRDEEVRRRLLSVKKLMGPMWHTQLDDRWNCVFYVGPLELTLAERSDFGKLYLNSIGSGNGAAFQASGVTVMFNFFDYELACGMVQLGNSVRGSGVRIS
uniref:Uncharacterized protein n=1 Tax=Syphacia muris TaxID=451379 RepID=A0A0N5AQ33_9BILA